MRVWGIQTIAASVILFGAGYAVAQQSPSPTRENQQPGAESAAGQASPSGTVQDRADPSRLDRGQPGQNQAESYQPGQRQFNQDQAGQDRTRQAWTSQQGQEGQLDHCLARLFISKNECEVKLAQLGVEKARDEQVREFATRLVRDHQQLIDKLQPLAGMSDQAGGHSGAARSGDQPYSDSATGAARSEGRTGTETDQPLGQGQQRPQATGSSTPSGTAETGRSTSDATSDAARRTAADAARGAAARQDTGHATESRHMAVDASAERIARMGRGGTAQQLVGLIDRVHAQMIDTLTQGLQQKDGAEFDLAFMRHQVFGHLAARDALSVIKPAASGQLQQVLGEAEQMVGEHLRQAQMIEQRLSQSAARTAAEGGIQPVR
ncbi:MAG: DUF4142 domain-containing protein [Planctomycetota bacterium]